MGREGRVVGKRGRLETSTRAGGRNRGGERKEARYRGQWGKMCKRGGNERGKWGTRTFSSGTKGMTGGRETPEKCDQGGYDRR